MRQSSRLFGEQLDPRLCLTGSYSAELLVDVAEGPEGSFPEEMAVFGDAIHFAINPSDASISPNTPDPSYWRLQNGNANKLADLSIDPSFNDRANDECAVVKEQFPSAIGSQLRRGLSFDDRVYFIHDYGMTCPGVYIEAADVWISDGTAGGTSLLTRRAKIRETGDGDVEFNLTEFQGDVFYTAGSSNSNSGRSPRILRHDGDTQTVTDGALWAARLGNDRLLTPDWRDPDVAGFDGLGGFYDAGFSILDASGQWTSSDADVYVGYPQIGGPGLFSEEFIVHAEGENVVFFTGYFRQTTQLGIAQPAEQPGIWRTDGTSEGTELVFEAQPWSDSNRPRISTVGDNAFIAQRQPNAMYFVSDAETSQLQGVEPNVEITPVAFDGSLYFANDTELGTQLWKSDGTQDGTVMVSEQHPFEIVVFDDRIFFTTEEAEYGHEIWSTDGTPEGTALAVDINPGTASSNAMHLVATDAALYLSADDGVHGQELWMISSSADALQGDINGDGNVGFADFLILSLNFGRSENAELADGDIDGNGMVEFADFLLLSHNFGNQIARSN